jgi:hypothetical protein
MQSEQDLILTPEEISLTIVKRQLNGFRVDTGHSPLSIGFWLHRYNASGPQTFLDVRIESKTKAPNEWSKLIETLLVRWQSVGAWQWNTLYSAWQSCSEVKSLGKYFGMIPSRARRYNERPLAPGFSAVERLEICRNPGRRKSLLPAIDFLPTAEMWLGPDFWQYTKCTREQAMEADFFHEIRDTPHFLYLKSWPEAFTRPDGEQGRQQQRIWKLFFNEDCEWPPGSGEICDEPMYGPPELMP